MDSDPWTAVTYLGDGAGSSVISLTISNFTLQPGAAHNVAGRVIVVHVDGLKAACGVIEPYGVGHAEVMTIGKYPDAPTSAEAGYTVPASPFGLMIQKDTDAGLYLDAILTGFQTSFTGGTYHIHPRRGSAAGTDAGAAHTRTLATPPSRTLLARDKVRNRQSRMRLPAHSPPGPCLYVPRRCAMPRSPTVRTRSS